MLFFMQKTIPSSKIGRQCSQNAQASTCECPYWSGKERACTLVKEGLFLPTEAHLTAYCISPHHSSCDHFQRLAPQPEPPSFQDTPAINRRRSVRVPLHSIFRFSEIGGQEHHDITLLEESYTLDISGQGLCFASRRRLTPDTVIRFSVEEENEPGLRRGQGRVVWSQRLESKGLFGCGVEVFG